MCQSSDGFVIGRNNNIGLSRETCLKFHLFDVIGIIPSLHSCGDFCYARMRFFTSITCLRTCALASEQAADLIFRTHRCPLTVSAKIRLASAAELQCCFSQVRRMHCSLQSAACGHCPTIVGKPLAAHAQPQVARGQHTLISIRVCMSLVSNSCSLR